MKNIYAILDSVAATYTPPILLNNDDEAKRVFRDACLNPDLPMGAHSADYSIWHIGYYDTSTGVIDAVTPHHLILKGHQTPKLKAVGDNDNG